MCVGDKEESQDITTVTCGVCGSVKQLKQRYDDDKLVVNEQDTFHTHTNAHTAWTFPPRVNTNTCRKRDLDLYPSPSTACSKQTSCGYHLVTSTGGGGREGSTHVVSEHHSQFPDLVLDVNGVQSENEMRHHTDIRRKDSGGKDRSVWLKEERSVPWRVFPKGPPPVCNGASSWNVLFPP